MRSISQVAVSSASVRVGQRQKISRPPLLVSRSTVGMIATGSMTKRASFQWTTASTLPLPVLHDRCASRSSPSRMPRLLALARLACFAIGHAAVDARASSVVGRAVGVDRLVAEPASPAVAFADFFEPSHVLNGQRSVASASENREGNTAGRSDASSASPLSLSSARAKQMKTVTAILPPSWRHCSSQALRGLCKAVVNAATVGAPLLEALGRRQRRVGRPTRRGDTGSSPCRRLESRSAGGHHGHCRSGRRSRSRHQRGLGGSHLPRHPGGRNRTVRRTRP